MPEELDFYGIKSYEYLLQVAFSEKGTIIDPQKCLEIKSPNLNLGATLVPFVEKAPVKVLS